MPYRLLFLDLDGTLVGDHDIVSPRNRAALDSAVSAGCTVVICTARTPYMAKPVGEQWHGHGYGVFVNGAVITEWETGEILQKRTVERSAAVDAGRIALAAGLAPLYFGTCVETDGGFAVRALADADRHAPWTRINGDRVVIADPADLDTVDAISIGVYGGEAEIRSVAEDWRAALTGRVNVWDAPDPRYEGWCAYMTAAGVDKASGARFVAKMLGVDRDETMAIGDHLNDLDLIRWVGLGVCMGGGHPDLEAAADVVTETCDNDGVARAIEKYVIHSGS